MKILAVCAGAAETLPGRKSRTGINKHAVSGAVMIDGEGLIGDAICDRRHHGGRDQAVYVEDVYKRQVQHWPRMQSGRPDAGAAYRPFGV